MTALEITRSDGTALTRGVFLGASMAVLFSAHALLVLTYGAVGLKGNSALTGGFLITAELAIFLLALRRIKLSLADYCFGAFALCIAISFTINGRTADVKETALLALALASYLACRCVSHSSLDKVRSGFIMVTATVAVVGSVVTLLAIIDQWPVPRGKPIVLGFDATTSFLSGLGFVILAIATKPLTPWRRAALFALLLIPVAIFAAAMIRFAFFAIVCALLLEAALSPGRQRFYVLIIIASVLASIAAGLWVRYDTAKVLMDYAIEKIEAKESSPYGTEGSSPSRLTQKISPPSCSLDVNKRNSVAIRKALYQDAFYLVPQAGLFGFGLDSFLAISCVTGHTVHNTFLQAIIEFGWLGGLSLALLICAAAIRLVPIARKDAGVRFVLCSLAYVTLMSMVHGRIGHDIWLFGLIGFAAGIADKSKLASASSS